MGMSLTNRPLSEKVRQILDYINREVEDPHDIIDVAIILTVLSYGIMYELDNVESSKEFIDLWVSVIKQNIDKLEGD